MVCLRLCDGWSHRVINCRFFLLFSLMNFIRRCIANCKDKLDPQMRLSLTGSCADCGKHVTYKWTLLTRDSIEVPLRWMLDTRTPQNSVSFVLLPSILSRSMQYFARFSASTPTGRFHKFLFAQ